MKNNSFKMHTKPMEVEVTAIRQNFGLPDRYRVTHPFGWVTYMSREELESRYEHDVRDS